MSEMAEQMAPAVELAAPDLASDESPLVGLGIIKINSQEWWAASSIEAAIRASAKHFGIPEHEVLDELYPPYRLSSEELWASTLYVNGQVVSFMTALMQRVDEGFEFPHLFGTND